MNRSIPDGVWPTMLTPFTDDNKVDYAALEELTEWYIKYGVNGLFAVCQSSEMYYLTLEERVSIAKFVKEKAGGRVPIIASGHISDNIEDQITELKAIADTGVDAVVMVSNRLAKEDESDDVWKRNIETVLNELPADVKLGFYECPYPYKRLISPDMLKWCAETDRFLFLKDTCCDLEEIRAKLKAVEGTGLKIYNANTATLLKSLEDGLSGYSGVMANFHPDLYVWLVENFNKEPKKAEELSNFLGLASVIECQLYPVNAKYALSLEGINIDQSTRAKDKLLLTDAIKMVVKQLFELTKRYRDTYNL